MNMCFNGELATFGKFFPILATWLKKGPTMGLIDNPEPSRYYQLDWMIQHATILIWVKKMDFFLF